MTSARSPTALAAAPGDAASAHPPFSRTRRILPRRSCTSSSRMPWSRITRMSFRISAMSMRGEARPRLLEGRPPAQSESGAASVDADALGGIVGRGADALAVVVLQAGHVLVVGACADALPRGDHAEPATAARRV